MPAGGGRGDLGLTVVTALLFVAVYRRGLRVATPVAVVKAAVIFSATVAVLWAATAASPGTAAVYAAAELELARSGGELLLGDGPDLPYVALAVGLALALVV